MDLVYWSSGSQQLKVSNNLYFGTNQQTYIWVANHVYRGLRDLNISYREAKPLK